MIGAAVVASILLFGVFYAGSPTTLAEGVHVAGIDVGGLTAAEAQAVLEHRAQALEGTPVTFVAGGTRWQLTPAQLSVRPDWAKAVDTAQHAGEGFAPVRGLRRLQTRVFGADITPPARVFDPALAYAVTRIARGVDASPRAAALRLRGLRPVLVAARPGRKLDRSATEHMIVRALSTLERGPVVALPVQLAEPPVAAGDLSRALDQARLAVSAPVRLRLGPTRWRIPRWRIAKLLSLPADGRTQLAIGGPEATHWLAALGRRVNRKPKNADFGVHANGTVFVIPAAKGRKLDGDATSAALLRGALSRSQRTARIAVVTAYPQRSTSEARAMGIERQVAAYTTIYGGDPNRLHNVRLVAQLTDKALIAPGATFSFNAQTGERTSEKGFLEAPVIINGELQNGLGGGVCQVSTTVYNAAYEAGLPIEERTNHALYISHYPLGRDATVNYPDLDLKFRNDTGKWLLLRTWVGESSLTVALYGKPSGRRVETEAGPLVVTGPPTERRVADTNMFVGEEVTDEVGEPARTRRCAAWSTTAAASSSTTRRGARGTAPSRLSSATARRRSPSRRRLPSLLRRRRRARSRRLRPSRPRRRLRRLRRHLSRSARQPPRAPRPASRARASDGTSARRRSRGPSSRARHAHRPPARAGTRSGSAPRARARTARAAAAGRRSAPPRRSARVPR